MSQQRKEICNITVSASCPNKDCSDKDKTPTNQCPSTQSPNNTSPTSPAQNTSAGNQCPTSPCSTNPCPTKPCATNPPPSNPPPSNPPPSNPPPSNPPPSNPPCPCKPCGPISAPLVKLSNGYSMPAIGLGTYQLGPGEATEVVCNAIDAGYRHIDCALFYQNESEVGAAITTKIGEGVVTREDLFITSKLWNSYHRPDLVEICLQQSLKDLGVEYVDLYIMHWPLAYKEFRDLVPKTCITNKVMFSDVDILDTWKAMEKLVTRGLVKSLGLSNFNRRQIERILANCSMQPVVLQIEVHPYLSQKKLVSFAESKDLVVTAYCPLAQNERRPCAKPGDGPLLEEQRLIDLARKHKKTPAQIVLRWHVQRSIIPVPKTAHRCRLYENINIFDFQLSDSEMETVSSLNCNGRLISYDFAKEHPEYPFNDEY